MLAPILHVILNELPKREIIGHWSLARALLLRKIGCSVTQNEAYRIRVDDDDKKRMIFDVNLPLTKIDRCTISLLLLSSLFRVSPHIHLNLNQSINLLCHTYVFFLRTFSICLSSFFLSDLLFRDPVYAQIVCGVP